MNYVNMDDSVCPEQYAWHVKWMHGQNLLSESFYGRMQESVLDDVR